MNCTTLIPLACIELHMEAQDTAHDHSQTAPDGGDVLDDSAEAFNSNPWIELTEHRAACRMLLALLDGQAHDFNKSDLADLAGVGRRTVHNNIDLLVDLDLVEETRVVGGAQMYSLASAEESDAVDGFIHFHDALGDTIGDDGGDE